LKNPTKTELIKRVSNLEDDARKLKRSIKHMLLDLTPFNYVDKSLDHTSKPHQNAIDVISRAQNEWAKNVTEPELGGDFERINLYIKSREGAGWTWEKDYTENGQLAWCGFFAAFCYTKAKFNIRKKIFPSCYRMCNAWSGTTRKVATILPSDIVVVFTSKDKTPHYGNHITIALSSPNENGDFDTIEGNAKGYGPNDDYREGVSKRTRNLEDVAHIYRLSHEDYDE
jgi:hypothetical protein